MNLQPQRLFTVGATHHLNYQQKRAYLNLKVTIGQARFESTGKNNIVEKGFRAVQHWENLVKSKVTTGQEVIKT